ncbi:MAG: immunoglobulin domain-containing protein [Fidelibacterota bacterium]|nr:MAG: immunoglobulin domain-containing protein [Candidatus Neomarinimicrobiota bacterium]
MRPSTLLTTLICILTFIPFLHAQPDTLWTKAIGFELDEMFNSIEPMADGGFILGGHTESNPDTIRNYWLVRVNSTGDDTVWTRAFLNDSTAMEGTEGRMAIATSDGGAIVVGSGNPRIIKTDGNGTVVWQKDENEIAGDIYWIEETADGGLIACGSYRLESIASAYIVRTNSSGTVIWDTTYGGEHDSYGFSITELSNGGFAMAGTYRALPESNSNDAWLLKLSTDGDSLASVFFGNTTAGNSEHFKTVRATSDGGLILVGNQRLEGQDGNIILIKTDGDGVQAWEQTFGGTDDDEAFDVIQTSDSGFTLTGYGDLTSSGGFDLLLIHTAADGTTDWTRQISGSSVAAGTSLIELSAGEYLVAGAVIPETSSYMDGWIVRLGTAVDSAAIKDSLALVDLYNSTNGTNWTNDTNWLNPDSALSTWNGVTVVGGRVTELYLRNNNLTGTIPASIGDLSELTELQLGTNQFTGPIPGEIGDLAKLTILGLQNCGLTEVPAEIGNLPELDILYLYNNNLTGPFPAWITNISTLWALQLHNNDLSGPIPAGITNLSHLQYLYIENNRFDFADIETILAAGAPLVDFTYSPQAEIGSDSAIIAFENESVLLTVATGGTANQYQWQKDDVDILVAENPTANNDTLLIEGTNVEDSGDYTLKVTNTSAPDLTLTSRPIHLTVLYGDFESDSLALVTMYDSTGGASWNSSTNWLTTAPLADWQGVTVSGDRVTALDLGENNLVGSLPAAVGNLTALTSLKLHRNQLTSIPDEIGNLVYLTLLWLIDNDLTVVPAGIGNLVNLKDLYLSDNQLTTLPAEFSSLLALDRLALNGNPLPTIPDGVFSLANLSQLDLHECELSGRLPDGIGALTNLNHLSLYRNELDSLPPAIGNLEKVEYLDLAWNQLRSIPPEIGNLASLNDVRFTSNELRSIPSTLGNLTNLEHLYLDENELDSLPGELSGLTNLIYLQLSYNRLTSLPSWIADLDTLWGLLLRGNRLSTFPVEILELSQLFQLDLIENELEELPDLSPMDSLSQFYLAGNRLTFEDIEPLLDLGIDYMYYGYMDSVGSPVDTTVAEGSSLTLTVTVGGSANHYEWQRLGVYPVGGDSDTLIFPSVTAADTGIYICKITSDLVADLTLYSEPIHVSIGGTVTIDNVAGIPEEYALHANYPNPFNPSTRIRYDLPKAADVILTVYDLLGREVVRLVDGHMEPGYQQVIWNGRTSDGREVPSGVYIARMVSTAYTHSIKMVLMK